MKKLAYIFLFGIISIGQAQDFWTGLNGPFGGTINDIVSPSAGVMIASTANGVYRSVNSGDSWSRVALGTDNSFTDLEVDPSSSGNKIFAATSNGARVYVSADAGATWTQLVTSGVIAAITKIKVASTGTTIYMIDTGLRLLKSTNSGGLFSVSTTFGVPINDLDLDNLNNVYVSTNGQGIRVSADGTTFPSVTGSPTVVYSAAINSTGTIYCLGPLGAYKSTNAGLNYAPIITGLADASYSGLIDLDATGNIFLCNNSSSPQKIYTSTAASGGALWTFLGSPFWPLPATTSYFQSSTAFYLGLGNIGVTKYAASTWSISSAGIKALQLSTNKIFKLDNALFVSGANLGYYDSPNGGQTWNLDANGVTSRNIVGFIKLSDNSVLGYGNGVIRLPNLASPWAEQNPSQTLSELVSSNGINLFSYSSGTSNLLSSVNQGISWTTQAITGLPGSPTKIQVDAANNIYFKVANEIYKVPAATTAAAKLTALTATTIQDFQVKGNSVYVLGNTNTLFAAIDNGGASFISKNAPASSSTLWVHDANHMFIRTTLNNFFVSKDGGGIWTNQPLLDAQAVATDAFVSAETYLYVATSNSVVHRSVHFIIPPAAPTDLTTIGKSFDRVELMWTDNAINEENYVIEMSAVNNLNYAPVDLGFNIGVISGTFGNKANVNVQGLTKNTQYFFRIKAVNSAASSAYSNEISVTTLDQCTSAIPNNRSWTAVAEADPGSTPSGPGPFTNATVNIVSVFNTPNNFTISGYDFGINPAGPLGTARIIESCGQVFLFEGNSIPNGNGSWNGTNTLVLKWQDPPYFQTNFQGTTTFTLNPTDPVPAIPSLNAYLYSGTEVLLNWNSIPFAVNYDVERATVSGGPYTPLITVNYPAVTYLDKNLTTGLSYYYRITAKNTASSATSAEAGILLQNGLFRPVENAIQLNFENQQGISWGDLDGDGDEDIASPSFTNNALQTVPPVFYENLGNGKDFTRRDLTVLQIENTAVSRGINLFDFNNDGKLDMYITRSSDDTKDLMLMNDGAWSFTKQFVTPTEGMNAGFRSAAAADYDQDGLVDVFVGNGNAQTLPDLLLKNSGGSSLIEIAAGALTTDLGDSRNVSWIDYDNDNDQDMFVLNSSGSLPNRLYKNNGDGTFTKVTGLVFDSDIMAGARTVSWGDIDNDGDFDLYVGSQSGSVSPLAVDRLYQNNGNGTFTSIGGVVAESATATFGSSFGDIDNDGDLDLIAINTAANSIFQNNGNGTFTKYTGQEMANHPGIAEIGGALADFDKDGFLDFYPSKGQTTATDLPNFLYRNLTTPSVSRNWIELKLVGTLSNKSAIGARVTVTTISPARTQIREVSTRTGYGSANSLIAHIGIGTATAISNIQIKWPSGFVQNISNPTINQVLTVTEDVHADLTFTAPTTLDSKFVSTAFSTGVTINFGSLSGVKLYYRKIGGGEFTELEGVFNAGTSKWDFEILRDFADGNGLEYYLTAQTGSSTIGRLPLNSATNFYTYLNYQEADNPIPSDHIGLGGTKESWKIFSIPFDLGSNNNVNTIFNEFTDLNLIDKVDWRMLTYTDATAWGEFPEDFSTITRGKGYFINIKNSVGITIPEASASNNRKNLFQIALETGWNQIGNPYLTPISWADVVTMNNLTGTATQLKTFSGGSYTNATELNPFEGGFVFSENDVTVSIPFQGQTALGGRKAESNLAEGDWILPIILKQGDTENNFGGVGMRSNAKPSFDEYDDFNGPRFIKFIEMNFDHPEHFVKQFARDVVSVQDEYVWNFSVESSLSERAVLNWSQSDIISKDLFLFDEGLQSVINMREISSYAFQPAVSKSFKIYFGENVEKKILPSRVLLAKAYPNPTTNETTINYTLAESSSRYQVKLEVFDTMGKKVATLAHGNFNPGFYSVSLDINQYDLPNGLYTCRLMAVHAGGQHVLSQKIVVKK